MTERKQKIKEIFEAQGIYLSDDEMDNLGTAIGDTLHLLADEIEEKEPYATVTIARYRDVARDVDTSINDEE